MTLHPDLYPSNIRISDITETLDHYYTALYHSLNNPEKPPELYTKGKVYAGCKTLSAAEARRIAAIES